MPKKPLLYENVLEHIKLKIADGSYGPGDRLPPVTTLAKELGVAVSTVREGMRALAMLGLISVKQGHGTFITDKVYLAENPLVSFQIAEDTSLAALLEVRLIVEPILAGLAAERIEPEQVKSLLQAVEEQERTTQEHQDHLPADIEFHRIILEASKNPVFKKMLEAVDDLLLESRRRSSRIEGSANRAVHYHFIIANAIQKGDAEQARRLMKEHILDVNDEIIRSFRKPSKGVPPPP